jgi:hypothetical protein
MSAANDLGEFARRTAPAPRRLGAEKTHDLERLYAVLTVRRSDLAGPADPLCKALAEVYFADLYPGFDLEDPDWPKLREQLRQIEGILLTVKSRLH